MGSGLPPGPILGPLLVPMPAEKMLIAPLLLCSPSPHAQSYPSTLPRLTYQPTHSDLHSHPARVRCGQQVPLPPNRYCHSHQRHPWSLLGLISVYLWKEALTTPPSCHSSQLCGAPLPWNGPSLVPSLHSSRVTPPQGTNSGLSATKPPTGLSLRSLYPAMYSSVS